MDANDLISQLAAGSQTSLDELLAHPPGHFTSAGQWRAFLIRLREQRAEIQLSRGTAAANATATEREENDSDAA